MEVLKKDLGWALISRIFYLTKQTWLILLFIMKMSTIVPLHSFPSFTMGRKWNCKIFLCKNIQPGSHLRTLPPISTFCTHRTYTYCVALTISQVLGSSTIGYGPGSTGRSFSLWMLWQLCIWGRWGPWQWFLCCWLTKHLSISIIYTLYTTSHSLPDTHAILVKLR